MYCVNGEMIIRKRASDFIDNDIPRVWDDKNCDGEWDHQEEMTVMASDFERQMKNLKANLFFYFDIGMIH